VDSSWLPNVWLSWVLLVGGFVILAVVLVRVLVGGVTRGPERASGEPAPSGRRPAQQILDERLARGEITLEQYQAMSRALSGEQG
jgi:putative membrane protein